MLQLIACTVSVIRAYHCPPHYRCPRIRLPVCGSDGITYKNPYCVCEKNVEISYFQPCEESGEAEQDYKYAVGRYRKNL